MGHDTGVLQRGEEEEVGVVEESDVLVLCSLPCLSLIDAKLHNRWRVDGASVSRRWTSCQIFRLCGDVWVELTYTWDQNRRLLHARVVE